LVFRLPAVERDVLERRHELAAGIVDEAMDRRAGGKHVSDGRADLLFFADVADMQRRRVVSGRVDLGGDSVELLAVAPDQRDECSERGKLVGGAAPDAAATAGDDNALAVERAGPEHRTILQGRPLWLPTILSRPGGQESVPGPSGEGRDDTSTWALVVDGCGWWKSLYCGDF
jgi:hypothetical protein